MLLITVLSIAIGVAIILAVWRIKRPPPPPPAANP
jgi:hypothetical protein